MMSQTYSFFHEVEGKRWIRPALFGDEALAIASEIRRSGLKASQFRNYFQELRGLEARFKQNERESQQQAWLALQPQLQMFKAKLAYGSRRDGPLSQAPAFRTFMDKLIDTGLESPDSFHIMMLFVEAVLAYYYAEESQGGRR